MKKHVATAIAALAWMSTQSATAQEDLHPYASPRLTQHLSQWRAEHGSNWELRLRPRTGYAQLLFGGRRTGPLEPQTDAEWFHNGRFFVEAAQQLFGVESATLRDAKVMLLPLGQINTTDKMSVQFRQELGGIPVEGGSVHVLLDMQGRLLSIQSNATPQLMSLERDVTLSADAALELGRTDFLQRAGALTAQTQPELIFAQADAGAQRITRLAWTFELRFEEAGSEPQALAYFVDAANGALLKTENLIHYFDVNGTVTTMASPGVNPDSARNSWIMWAWSS